MIALQVSELKPGMKLAKDVILSDGRLLLLAGFAVKPLYIRKLEAFNVQSVYIDEAPYIPIEEFNEEKLYIEAFNTIKKVLKSVSNGENIDVAIVKETVNNIVRMVIGNETVMLQIAGIRDIDNYTFLHSIDVCIYSVILGKKIGYSNEQLTNLGMGAILHDIGKCKVPLSILQKPEKLTDNEFNTMKLHTIYGCEIIKNTNNLNTKIANIAFQHHEKWDGSGYPLGIKSDTIDPFSRIITVADIYDALTADRVYKKKILPHIAAEYIMNNSSILFDPYIADLFVSNIAIYAEGTVVLLSTGEVGIIISSLGNSSSKHKINIIANKSGPPVLNPYVVDLAQRPEIEIAEVFV